MSDDVPAFKHWLDEARHRRIAEHLATLHPRFDAECFLRHALDGLETRELMARVARLAEAFHLALPVPLAEQLAVLRAHAGSIGHNFVGIWPCAHVAAHGLEHPELALPALRDLTRHGSAEFAVRPFLRRDLEGTLVHVRAWAEDADEHVRRLASEGCRPRLPWGGLLPALVADPRPLLPVLARLRADPSAYVRKSVANHLNDIAKDHPALAIDVLSGWELDRPETAWIARHALRVLVKRGHPGALGLLGIGAEPRVEASLTASPKRVAWAGTVVLRAGLVSTARRTQKLEVDYVVHYARASGRASAKVFKWRRLDLAAGAEAAFEKRLSLRDLSTRRHHPGAHRVELQVNGRRLAEAEFVLTPP